MDNICNMSECFVQDEITGVFVLVMMGVSQLLFKKVQYIEMYKVLINMTM